MILCEPEGERPKAERWLSIDEIAAHLVHAERETLATLLFEIQAGAILEAAR